jgi:hypothetical protein
VDFSGRIGGALKVVSNGVGSFLGTNSTFSGSMSLTHYVETSSGGVPFAKYILGVANFGRAGESSAIGTNGIVYSRYRGGRFLYLGDGETTDKKFIVRLEQIVNSDAVPFEIDGGAAGGLVLEGGEFDNEYAGSAAAIPRILLSGTNASPCVVAGGSFCALRRTRRTPAPSRWRKASLATTPLRLLARPVLSDMPPSSTSTCQSSSKR